MLLFGYIIWTLFFFLFVFVSTFVISSIFSLVNWFIFRKSNYILLIFLNLLIIIPCHLFYSGQITYTFKTTYKTGTLDATFYLGFLLYLGILSSCYIHKEVTKRLQKKN